LLLWAIINHPSRIVKQKAAKQAAETMLCRQNNLCGRERSVSAAQKDGGLLRSFHCCHCEERSDAAISIYKADTNYEIAEFIPSHKNEIASPSARNDGEGPLALPLEKKRNRPKCLAGLLG
jgi:hypothetical protein